MALFDYLDEDQVLNDDGDPIPVSEAPPEFRDDDVDDDPVLDEEEGDEDKVVDDLIKELTEDDEL